MQSRSQNEEDLFVLDYFGTYKGMLISIGENDGTTLSNSRLLIENGWQAALFEPGGTYNTLDELYKDNPKVHCYNFGIGEKNEVVDFWESGCHVPEGADKGLVSTTNFEETKRWHDVKFTKKQVKLIPFSDIVDYAPVDFISIDAEGMDWSILKQIDLTKIGCRCLCIEWNGDMKLWHNIVDYCVGYGMKLATSNQENLIFVR